MAVYMIKIERSNMSEKGWKMFLFVVIFLWLVTISTIIYFVVSGTAPLIDRSIDLYYITLPILALALIYVSVSICIFGIYLVGYEKVKNKQLIAINREIQTKSINMKLATTKIRCCTNTGMLLLIQNINMKLATTKIRCCTNTGMLLLIQMAMAVLKAYYITWVLKNKKKIYVA